MKDYFLVLLSVMLLAIAFIFQKLYQKEGSQETFLRGINFNIISGFFSLLLLLAMNGIVLDFSWYSFINSTLRAICILSCIIIGFWIMKQGNMALYMLFLMSGGMILPAIYGWIFLAEPIIAVRVIGVAIILISIVITKVGNSKTSIKVFLSCSAVFMLNGFVSTLSKVHQINQTYETISTTSYEFYCTAIRLIISLVLWLFFARNNAKEKTSKTPIFKSLLVAAMYSITYSISAVLQLIGAKNLPASVLYPIITGGNVVLTGVFALIFFREKPSKQEWIGIILCLIGTCMFL